MGEKIPTGYRVTRAVGRAFAACAFAACLAVMVSSAPSSASTASTTTRTSVVSKQVWTDSRVVVRSGDVVTINATGLIHFGAKPIDRMAPKGVAWGRPCNRIEGQSAPAAGWPAPGLACWSLIGRIGSGPPFEVGAAKAVHAVKGGALFLGVNDNFLGDNAGTWSVTVTVTVSRPVPTVSTVPRTTSAPKHTASSGSFLAIAALAFVMLVVIVGLIAVAMRRRRARGPRVDDGPAPAVSAAPTPSTIISHDPHPQRASDGAQSASSVYADSIDVNIFEVEFAGPATLRVGYNHFPEGTVVQWRAGDGAASIATGEFVADGGGGTNHFVTLPLGRELEATDAGVAVDFTWSVGGVPFRYSVKRDFAS